MPTAGSAASLANESGRDPKRLTTSARYPVHGFSPRTADISSATRRSPPRQSVNRRRPCTTNVNALNTVAPVAFCARTGKSTGREKPAKNTNAPPTDGGDSDANRICVSLLTEPAPRSSRNRARIDQADSVLIGREGKKQRPHPTARPRALPPKKQGGYALI